jgi:uncharacterized repeat protein (TIGR03803 family)
MRKLNWWKTWCAMSLLCAATAIALPAQTFTTLHSFDGTGGADPYAGLVQAADGDLYGTTYEAGAHGSGTIFKITPSGTVSTVYSFCSQSGCADGANPLAALIQATDGQLYGTTAKGGTSRYDGTIFGITPSGTLTVLYSFCSQSDCADGANPAAALVQATNGNFYGTTTDGGAGGVGGTAFEFGRTGTLRTLYSFCSLGGCADGEVPFGALIQTANLNFYGTTGDGGTDGSGTVFKITPGGTLITVHSFDFTDGHYPAAGLVQGTDQNLYGTTQAGGPNGYGTVFKITSTGTLTTLYSFCPKIGCADGSSPASALVWGSDGNLYGTTFEGGTNGQGTVFRISPGGTLATLYSFCSQSGCTDGAGPRAELVQDTDGNFYGTTVGGGTSAACSGGCGTAFSLSVGLAPFVETRPTFGKAGKPVKILGTDLTGATSVTFNGTPAAFTVESGSLIKTAVPAGATTGTVQVVTPSGTLSSNVPFRVAP